ncbi:hypothetical protein EC973_008872 [Apophysomyces ossiformis]|uniref:Methylenetetrahydrofolate reductase n=1 Tax=Apophysomyces ossiformis TaxID=679940 RepID=A0A8H7BSK7_9FUNG|nr:hypothetical protein EC973_008872 [Apophysomyces ossiformis]
MKIIDKIRRAQEENTLCYSFEYFPPKTEIGLANLFDRLARMASLEPTFVSCTWGAGGSTQERTLEICSTTQNIYGLETLMHLTCTNMERDKVDQALKEAKNTGIQNILALRGDPPRGHEYWTPCDGGFSHAVELVKYIRQEYGDYFCIGVAGYPEGHMDAATAEQDLQYLKEKVDAGADFIVTQFFYDLDIFYKWVKDCRDIGITVPIVPGIMPIATHQSFRRMLNLSKVQVPKSILDTLESIRTSEANRKWGQPKVENDITELFVQYIMGHLNSLPWCEEALETETETIRNQLADINRRGYWTISSQPAVNGAPSHDPVYGWGPKGGYVYQKAFIEFFVSKKQLDKLLKAFECDEYITYYAANRKGEFLTNVSDTECQNAVTWGVFPGKEIVQPTIIERANFEAWKDEAYALWTDWEQQYTRESDSAKLLKDIGEQYWLVNVVHNDFQEPDSLFNVFLS